jgi:Flp pilus assembly protein TadD
MQVFVSTRAAASPLTSRPHPSDRKRVALLGDRIIAALDATLARFPGATSIRFARARSLELRGDDVAAELGYRAVIADDPGFFRAYNDLGLLYHRHGLADDARACFAAAVEADPRQATGHANLGAVALAGGDRATAEQAFTAALERDPDHPGARAGLTALYEARGLPPPAFAPPVAAPPAATGDPFVAYCFEIAADAIVARQADAAAAFVATVVADHAAYAELVWRAADAAATARAFGAARMLFELALRLAPDDLDLRRARAIALDEAGDPAAATAWRELRGTLRVLPFAGDGAPVRLLVVASALHAIRYDLFCDPARFATTIVFTQTYDPEAPLPAHDVVLVAIGDVESDAPALGVARAIVARSEAPIVNRPDAIAHTARTAQAARFAAIEDVRVPRIVEVPRDANAVANALALLGLHPPVLLRSPGFHNGRFFERVPSAAAIAPTVAALPGHTLYAIEFCETRAADGFVRKYRAMTIDGRLYPVHLAISRDWKVHYVTSAMAHEPDLRAEEAAYLADMTAALGAPAVTALERIAALMDLDYGGIDFGIAPDGRVVVFEANAAMAIFLPDADPRWDYRRAAMTRALHAATQMLVDRATALLPRES